MQIPRDTLRRLDQRKILKTVLAELAKRADVEELFSVLNDGNAERTFFAAIANIPDARQKWEYALDMYRGPGLPSDKTIIVGSGIHAAIYAARAPGSKLVLDAAPVYGGIMGASRGKPAFYLNSRSRPGDGKPGERRGLNFMPGCVVEPNNISGLEYPTNADVSFCVRTSLALTCSIREINDVNRITKLNDNYYDCSGYNCKRVIIATGLGRSNVAYPRLVSQATYLTFKDFLNMWGRKTVPMQAFARKDVIVIGAGDSGKVVVEALLGMGPNFGGGNVTNHFVRRIFWYGQQSEYREEFEACERSRYHGIGRHFPRLKDPSADYRIYARPEKFTPEAPELGSGSIVIDCTGFKERGIEYNGFPSTELRPIKDGNVIVAQQVGNEEVYLVGPVMNLDPQPREQQIKALRQIDQNAVGIFRYAARTASFAETI